MTVTRRCCVLVALLLWSAGAWAAGGGSAEGGAAAVPDLQAGMAAVLRDIDEHFWNRAEGHIRPTNGCNQGQSGCGGSTGGVGEANDKLADLSFWEMAGYANVQHWQYVDQVRAADPAAATTRTRIAEQWAYIHKRWSNRQLSSAAPSTGIENVSDDAAWHLNYLVQVYFDLGDEAALNDAVALLPHVLDRWADPHAPRIDYGDGLQGSKYGILYAEPTGDPDHQSVSGIFEAMMGVSALDLFDRTGQDNLFDFARDVFSRTKGAFKKSCKNTTGACTADPAVYYTERDIKPCKSGTEASPCPTSGANPHFLQPVANFFGPPQRGCDATYLAGTMAMGVLAARLYDHTHEERYLDEARSTAAAMARSDTYLRTIPGIGPGLVNARDPWTDGYWAPYYVDEVLSRPGVDSSGLLKTAIRNTGLSIIRQRTSEGLSGGDWTPPEKNGCNAATSWAEQARALGGSGGGQAKPSQIMTAASSASMVQGAAMLDARPRRP